MQATFDVLSRTLSLETGDLSPNGVSLSATLARHGNVVPLRGVSFGFAMALNGEPSEQQHWPPAGVKYSKTDQDTLATYRLRWQPGDSVQVDVWLVDSQQQRHTATAYFVSPAMPDPAPDAPSLPT